MSWLYDRASCLAAPLEEGMRQLCPSEPAVTAVAALALALLMLVGWAAAEGSARELRRRRRRREFGLHVDED